MACMICALCAAAAIVGAVPPRLSREAPIAVEPLPQTALSISPAEIDRLRMHADAGRDAKAMASLLTAAQTGNAHAQRAIGEVLLNAKDSERATEALDWLQRSEEHTSELQSR